MRCKATGNGTCLLMPLRSGVDRPVRMWRVWSVVGVVLTAGLWMLGRYQEATG